jgi:hypothetical protein
MEIIIYTFKQSVAKIFDGTTVFDGTKQLNIILSSVREKTMRDLERTKERKFRKYAQTLDPRYKSSDIYPCNGLYRYRLYPNKYSILFGILSAQQIPE